MLFGVFFVCVLQVVGDALWGSKWHEVMEGKGPLMALRIAAFDADIEDFEDDTVQAGPLAVAFKRNIVEALNDSQHAHAIQVSSANVKMVAIRRELQKAPQKQSAKPSTTRARGKIHSGAIADAEPTQIHVRGIGVHGWDGSEDGLGTYEHEDEIRKVFAVFGHVLKVMVRHRVKDGANTSWCLVTMASSEAADAALAAPEVLAGDESLRLTRYDNKQALLSKGGMKQLKQSTRTERGKVAAVVHFFVSPDAISLDEVRRTCGSDLNDVDASSKRIELMEANVRELCENLKRNLGDLSSTLMQPTQGSGAFDIEHGQADTFMPPNGKCAWPATEDWENHPQSTAEVNEWGSWSHK